MSKERSSFLEAVAELAKAHGVVAFALCAVTPIDEGFGLSAGAASRLDENAPENDRVFDAMQESVVSAIFKLKTGKITSEYLN